MSGVVQGHRLDPENDQWLEQLAEATEDAIARLREFNDPHHVALLEDLRAFFDRLNAELGR